MDDNWFNRYPRPLYCLHDNGGEFIGEGFVEMLKSYGVQSQPTTVKNPQSNGAHERMHLVLCEMLRTKKCMYQNIQQQWGKLTGCYKVQYRQLEQVSI